MRFHKDFAKIVSPDTPSRNKHERIEPTNPHRTERDHSGVVSDAGIRADGNHTDMEGFGGKSRPPFSTTKDMTHGRSYTPTKYSVTDFSNRR